MKSIHRICGKHRKHRKNTKHRKHRILRFLMLPMFPKFPVSYIFDLFIYHYYQNSLVNIYFINIKLIKKIQK